MSIIPAEAKPPIFFRLPNAVLNNFLSEWLDIVDAGRLDAAMTTRALRPKFLQCLQEMKSTTVNGKTSCANSGAIRSCTFLAWLSSRRIYVEEIFVWDLDSAFITENLEFPFLRKLHVVDVKLENYFVNFVKTSPALQSITILAGSKVVHEVLQQIADHCPLLEVLILQCSFLMDDLLYLLSKCSALAKFDLWNGYERWKDDDWERLRPYGHLMHEINATKDITNLQGFADFLGSCSRLHSLSYGKIENENHGMILLRVAQSCPLLESLSFYTCSSASLQRISRNCKKLREINIWDDSSPLSVADLACFKEIEKLETLSLFRYDLTNDHLAVISGFQNMKKLHIYANNETIFVDGMFTGTPISRSLEKISFHSNFDEKISPMAAFTQCNNLREINLADCRCDDASLKLLAKHFPLLEKITMEYVEENIVGWTFFIAQHKHLKVVTFSKVYFSSDDEIAEACFLNHFNDLESYFPHITFYSNEY